MLEYDENKPKLVPENHHQILSVFFIVASLLGVFFTLGYIVGRNSPLLIGPSTASAHENEFTAPRERSAKPPAPPPAPAPARLTPVGQPPPAEAAKVIPPNPAPPPKPAEASPAPATPKPPVPAASGNHPAGVYLQLMATNKEGVDLMVNELRQKGFPALSSAIPEKSGWYRALVGPLPESAITMTRANLQAAGFPGDRAFKRNF